jgi:hypothetical protein
MALLRLAPACAALLQRDATVKREGDRLSDMGALLELELGERFLDPAFELRSPSAVVAFVVVDRPSLDRGDRT